MGTSSWKNEGTTQPRKGFGVEWGPEPTHRAAEGHPLTVAGLAHTAFPKRACCRGHVVIATAKLGAAALSGLTLLGLGLVGPGHLGKKLGTDQLPGGLSGAGRGWQGAGETEL